MNFQQAKGIITGFLKLLQRQYDNTLAAKKTLMDEALHHIAHATQEPDQAVTAKLDRLESLAMEAFTKLSQTHKTLYTRADGSLKTYGDTVLPLITDRNEQNKSINAYEALQYSHYIANSMQQSFQPTTLPHFIRLLQEIQTNCNPSNKSCYQQYQSLFNKEILENLSPSEPCDISPFKLQTAGAMLSIVNDQLILPIPHMQSDLTDITWHNSDAALYTEIARNLTAETIQESNRLLERILQSKERVRQLTDTLHRHGNDAQALLHFIQQQNATKTQTSSTEQYAQDQKDDQTTSAAQKELVDTKDPVIASKYDCMTGLQLDLHIEALSHELLTAHKLLQQSSRRQVIARDDIPLTVKLKPYEQDILNAVRQLNNIKRYRLRLPPCKRESTEDCAEDVINLFAMPHYAANHPCLVAVINDEFNTVSSMLKALWRAEPSSTQTIFATIFTTIKKICSFIVQAPLVTITFLKSRKHYDKYKILIKALQKAIATGEILVFKGPRYLAVSNLNNQTKKPIITEEELMHCNIVGQFDLRTPKLSIALKRVHKNNPDILPKYVSQPTTKQEIHHFLTNELQRDEFIIFYFINKLIMKIERLKTKYLHKPRSLLPLWLTAEAKLQKAAHTATKATVFRADDSEDLTDISQKAIQKCIAVTAVSKPQAETEKKVQQHQEKLRQLTVDIIGLSKLYNRIMDLLYIKTATYQTQHNPVYYGQNFEPLMLEVLSNTTSQPRQWLLLLQDMQKSIDEANNIKSVDIHLPEDNATSSLLAINEHISQIDTCLTNMRKVRDTFESLNPKNRPNPDANTNATLYIADLPPELQRLKLDTIENTQYRQFIQKQIDIINDYHNMLDELGYITEQHSADMHRNEIDLLTEIRTQTRQMYAQQLVHLTELHIHMCRGNAPQSQQSVRQTKQLMQSISHHDTIIKIAFHDWRLRIANIMEFIVATKEHEPHQDTNNTLATNVQNLLRATSGTGAAKTASPQARTNLRQALQDYRKSKDHQLPEQLMTLRAAYALYQLNVLQNQSESLNTYDHTLPEITTMLQIIENLKNITVTPYSQKDIQHRSSIIKDLIQVTQTVLQDKQTTWQNIIIRLCRIKPGFVLYFCDVLNATNHKINMMLHTDESSQLSPASSHTNNDVSQYYDVCDLHDSLNLLRSAIYETPTHYNRNDKPYRPMKTENIRKYILLRHRQIQALHSKTRSMWFLTPQSIPPHKTHSHKTGARTTIQRPNMPPCVDLLYYLDQYQQFSETIIQHINKHMSAKTPQARPQEFDNNTSAEDSEQTHAKTPYTAINTQEAPDACNNDTTANSTTIILQGSIDPHNDNALLEEFANQIDCLYETLSDLSFTLEPCAERNQDFYDITQQHISHTHDPSRLYITILTKNNKFIETPCDNTKQYNTRSHYYALQCIHKFKNIDMQCTCFMGAIQYMLLHDGFEDQHAKTNALKLRQKIQDVQKQIAQYYTKQKLLTFDVVTKIEKTSSACLNMAMILQDQAMPEILQLIPEITLKKMRSENMANKNNILQVMDDTQDVMRRVLSYMGFFLQPTMQGQLPLEEMSEQLYRTIPTDTKQARYQALCTCVIITVHNIIANLNAIPNNAYAQTLLTDHHRLFCCLQGVTSVITTVHKKLYSHPDAAISKCGEQIMQSFEKLLCAYCKKLDITIEPPLQKHNQTKDVVVPTLLEATSLWHANRSIAAATR